MKGYLNIERSGKKKNIDDVSIASAVLMDDGVFRERMGFRITPDSATPIKVQLDVWINALHKKMRDTAKHAYMRKGGGGVLNHRREGKLSKRETAINALEAFVRSN